MRNYHISKTLAVGIVILFVGTGIIPAQSSFSLKEEPVHIPNSSGKTIYVDDNNTEGPWDGTLEYPYQFIQDGVNHSSEGDTVYVNNGIYYEHIIVDKSINLIGENRDLTIIDGNGSGHIVKIMEDDVTVNGFSIKKSGENRGCVYITSDKNHVFNNSIYGYHHSYGIYLDEASYNDISENMIFSISFVRTGILLENSDFNLITKNEHLNYNHVGISLKSSNNNILSLNTIPGCFQGISILNSKNNEVIKNIISKAGSAYGAGIDCYNEFGFGNHLISKNIISSCGTSGMRITSDNNIIEYNIVQNTKKTGIILLGSFNTLNGNIIKGNKDGLWLSIRLNKVIRNSFEDNSNGIIVYGFKHTIKENNFIGNKIDAFFENSFLIRWSRNYWGLITKPYHIIKGKIHIYLYDSDPWDTYYPKLTFDWYNFDWNPAQRPYDIKNFNILEEVK